MHHKEEKLSFEQKIIIGFFRMFKYLFRSIIRAFKGGKNIYQQTKFNRTVVVALNKKDIDEMGNRWREIKDLINLGGISQMKQALIEADKLIDYILKMKRVQGSTMGERLINAKTLFSRDIYDNLWKAHKLRNTLAHEIDHEIFHWQIKESMKYFEDALNELEVL